MPPLTPYRWPQETLRVPNAGGRFMPPIEGANFDVSGSESFTMTGTFTFTTVADGGQLSLTIPTDQDGDFWCDQIACVAWRSNIAQMVDPFPAMVQIRDLRTGRDLTHPAPSVPIKFFNTYQLSYSDVGVTIGDSPPPAGFRSTATLPMPFCFTRQGGIQIVLTFVGAVTNGAVTKLLDFSFSGWKEYTYASQGRPK